MNRFTQHIRHAAFLLVGLSMLGLFVSGSPQVGAAGNTYYVSTSGDDSNAGTQSSPWRTIQKAASTMSAGDTVYVRGGTYPGNINIGHSGTSGNNISFVAFPGENAIIDCANTNRNAFTDRSESSNRSYFVIDGFRIANCVIGIELTRSNHAIVRNNEVKNSSQHGISVSTEGSGTMSDITVTGNSVHDTGVGKGGYNGIHVEYTTNSTISGNTVYDNRENGILLSHQANNNVVSGNTAYHNSCFDTQQYAGIAIEVDSQYNKVFNNISYNNCHAGYLTNSPNNDFFNNTLYGNQEAAISLGDWNGSVPTGNTFRDNIVVVTSSGDKAVALWKDSATFDAKQNSFDYNIYYYTPGGDRSDLFTLTGYGNFSMASWQKAGMDTHGKLANPLLSSPASADFHIGFGSPAIDAGTTTPTSVDKDGNSRPLAASYDVGAYEFVGSAPAQTATPLPAYPTKTPVPTALPSSAPTAVPPVRTSAPLPTAAPSGPTQIATATAVPPAPTKAVTATPRPATQTPAPTATSIPGIPTHVATAVPAPRAPTATAARAPSRRVPSRTGSANWWQLWANQALQR